MTDDTSSEPISLNARVGAIALSACAPLILILRLPGTVLAPMIFLCGLGLTFGLLCFCAEMGAHKPLNRAGMVLLAAAFCANVLLVVGSDPLEIARAQLLYAFAMLGALLLWSIALMHRNRTIRRVGTVGTVATGGAIVALILAHLFIGSAAIAGFSQLFSALENPRPDNSEALIAIDGITCLWALAVSALLWTRTLGRAG